MRAAVTVLVTFYLKIKLRKKTHGGGTGKQDKGTKGVSPALKMLRQEGSKY